MRHLVQESFSLNLRVLRCAGLYSPEKHENAYRVFTYAMFVFVTVPMPILALIYLLVTMDIGVEDFSNSMFLTSEFMCAVFKFGFLIRNREKLRVLFNSLEAEVFTSYRPHQKGIMDDCVWVCRRNVRVFLFCTLCSCTMCATTPLSREGRKFPIEIWWPSGWRSEHFYLYTYLYMGIVVVVESMANASLDLLMAGLAYHGAGQIKILKDNLENIVDDDTDVAVRDDVIYSRIRDCIKHHSAILKYVEDYEGCFSYIIFFQFMASTIVICVSCFQLMLVEPRSLHFLFIATYTNVMLVQILLYSFYGTELAAQSDQINQSVYMSKWYECDIRSRKSLIILMKRAGKPMVVTAGTILDVSLDTFTTILRRAYSLLAVLKNY